MNHCVHYTKIISIISYSINAPMLAACIRKASKIPSSSRHCRYFKVKMSSTIRWDINTCSWGRGERLIYCHRIARISRIIKDMLNCYIICVIPVYITIKKVSINNGTIFIIFTTNWEPIAYFMRTAIDSNHC